MLTANRSQITIFERSGKFVESCNTIMDYQHLEGKSVFEHIPMLQSIAPSLSQLQMQDAPIYLPAVSEVKNSETYYVDYHIYNHPEQKDYLVLLAMDYSEMYKKLIALQQERNELMMKMETDIPDA
ncbi:MAG: hypothetical protein AAF694_05615 [Bacteroidota bacterium]